MMRVLILLVLWALSLVYTESIFMRQSTLIDTAEKTANALKNGICELRLSVSEILRGTDLSFRHGYASFYAFIEDNKGVLDIPDDIVSSVKAFEEQSVYLSIKECEKLITGVCADIMSHLLYTRKELKNRLVGMRTVEIAFFLILLILLV